jgi:biopolymer transport protein ExbD
MLYRPSMRSRQDTDSVHTNIVPMMNLMVVLIPLLLTSAEFVRLGIIELNLPPAAVGPEGQVLTELPQEERRRLDLAVTITDKGFFISSSLAVLGGKQAGGPTIPLFEGEYDFSLLSLKLLQIKDKAKNRFPDTEKIIIMAEPNVDYQTVISTMDAARSITVDGRQEILFPDVSLSAAIF